MTCPARSFWLSGVSATLQCKAMGGHPASRWLKLPCAFAHLALQNNAGVRCPDDDLLGPGDHDHRGPDDHGGPDDLRPGVRRLPDAAAVRAVAAVRWTNGL